MRISIICAGSRELAPFLREINCEKYTEKILTMI